MIEYKIVKITDLGTVNRGKSKHRPRNDSLLYGGKYPFIQTADIKKANLYLSDYSQTYNEIGLKQSKLWKKGTLCFTIAANIADSAILDIDACFPDSIVGFLPHENVSDTIYVKYLFDELKLYFQQISKGTTQDNLSLDKICRVKLRVPNYETQKKIALVLSSYDNLIENNNKRIKLLEQMAENLYKEWFVRFRFPGYEDTVFENGIPKGWKIERLSDIADIIMGQSPKSENYNTNCEGLPFHQGVGSYGDFYLIDDIYSTKGNRIAEANSIIFSVRAPVGRINITLNKIILGRGVASINSVKGYNAYLLWMLKNQFQQEDIIGNGSICTSVTKKELFGFKILMPHDDLIQKFDSIAFGIESEMRKLSLINDNLTKQRDLLLPRLMSGKLEV